MPPKTKRGNTAKKVTRSLSRKLLTTEHQDEEPSSCSSLLSSSVDDGACGCPSHRPTRKTVKNQTKSSKRKTLPAVRKATKRRQGKQQICPNGKLDVNLCTITAMKKVWEYQMDPSILKCCISEFHFTVEPKFSKHHFGSTSSRNPLLY